MKNRCDNSNFRYYRLYGGRGISYSKDWEKFENFQKDMEKTYIKGLTIDRIDNNGNYCKENCRWSDWFTQANNTNRNRYIKFNGETKTLSEWIRFFGLKASTVRQRFYVYKWSVDRCFNKSKIN